MGASPSRLTIAPGGSIVLDTVNGPLEVHAGPCPGVDEPEAGTGQDLGGGGGRPIRGGGSFIPGESIAAVLMDDRVVAHVAGLEDDGTLTVDAARTALSSSGPDEPFEVTILGGKSDAAVHRALFDAAQEGGGNVRIVIPPQRHG